MNLPEDPITEKTLFNELPDFRLPNEVATFIREKRQIILERFSQDEAKRPQVVLVLERSALLPSTSTTSELIEKYPSDIQVVSIPVGKVLPYMFAEYKMQEIDPDIDETDINLSDNNQANEFRIWIQTTTDPTIVALREQLLALKLTDKNILVLDDAKASGETLEFTLRLLLEAVYSTPIAYDTECYFAPNVSWETLVIDQLEIELTSSQKKLLRTLLKGRFDLRRFKIELESGFYTIPEPELSTIKQLVAENYTQGTAILPITSEILIKMAGYQALMNDQVSNPVQDTQNPATQLLNTYGLNNLLEIHAKMEQKFREI